MSVWYDKHGKPYTITHTLSDGTVLDDITGHKIERNESNAGFYRVFDDMCIRYIQKRLMEKKNCAS